MRSGSATYYVDAGVQRRLVGADAFAAHGFQDRFVRTLGSATVYEDGPALTAAANLKFAKAK